MARWRRFERCDVRGGAAEFREIRLEGIRCRLRWSTGKDKVRATTSTFDDEERARRAEARKTTEWIRKGFVEVDPPAEDDTSEPDPKILDVIRASVGHGTHPDFTPVPGFDETFHREPTSVHPASHHNYYVLRDRSRSAVSFNVLAVTHDAEAVTAFLEFVTTRAICRSMAAHITRSWCQRRSEDSAMSCSARRHWGGRTQPIRRLPTAWLRRFRPSIARSATPTPRFWLTHAFTATGPFPTHAGTASRSRS